MFPPIHTTVSAASAVTALLGVDPVRFYPFGEAPEGVALPYAVWQQVGGSPENFLNQLPDIDSFTTQIDVYASTATQAQQVAQALRDAIEPVAHITAWYGDSTDPDTKRKKYTFQADWFVKR